MKLLLIIFTVFIASCNIEPPSEREYIPFLMEKCPDEKKYYPEETMVFVFNMEILPETTINFKAEGSPSKTAVETIVEGSKIIVLPPLPQNETLVVTITSGLKSFDYKPLFINTDTPSKTGKVELMYEIGGKIPELTGILPVSGRSATVGISFDGEVDLDKAVIKPPPERFFTVDSWAVLSYLSPVDKIDLKKVLSLERNSFISDLEITIDGDGPQKGELLIEHLVTDVSYTVTINDETALAVDIDGELKMCDRRCSLTIEGLKPLTKYNSEITVFTTTGIKSEKFVIETDKERPKIMITEIMHTPSKEPEKSWEFVEIYNYGNLDFDLTDCFVDDNDTNKGIDPLLLRNESDELMLRPGDLAIITGNEAVFGDLIGSALWLVTKDTTIADGGLTSKETVQIKCKRDGIMVTEANEDPRKFSTSRGFSFTVDPDGKFCASSVDGGTPGRIEYCPKEDEN